MYRETATKKWQLTWPRGWAVRPRHYHVANVAPSSLCDDLGEWGARRLERSPRQQRTLVSHLGGTNRNRIGYGSNTRILFHADCIIYLFGYPDPWLGMTQDDTLAEAVSLLQDLGLQEYEARCFIALTQLSTGTAKDIHEISEVPRTRVYDAVRVLESQGLVEVQHTNPQQYRSVGIDEATRTLRQKYDDRIDTLKSYLERIDCREPGTDDDEIQEVWSLTGDEAIDSRMLDLIGDADSEIALLVVDEDILSERLFDALAGARDRGVSVLLGGQTEGITARMGEEFPSTRVFETNLNWLHGRSTDNEIAISRILLVDQTQLLISSYYPDANSEELSEQAIFAGGLGNGIIVLLRRLVSSGLAAIDDPGT